MTRVGLAFTLALALTACTPASAPPANSAPADSATPDPPAAQSQCPEPTAGCMNENNYKACLAVEAKCPGKVLVQESCPLQFVCE